MEPTRGRGRPKKEDAMSAAERARRYRKNQKAAGLIKRYVTENTDPSATEDISFWIADNKRMGELLREAISQRDYLKSQVERLHQENDDLLNRAKNAEYANTVSLKDLIVMRHELKGHNCK